MSFDSRNYFFLYLRFLFKYHLKPRNWIIDLRLLFNSKWLKKRTQWMILLYHFYQLRSDEYRLQVIIAPCLFHYPVCHVNLKTKFIQYGEETWDGWYSRFCFFFIKLANLQQMQQTSVGLVGFFVVNVNFKIVSYSFLKLSRK